LRPKRVYIAMDTLACVSGTMEPGFYTSKVYPLPH
jgi:hypothetical protein